MKRFESLFIFLISSAFEDLIDLLEDTIKFAKTDGLQYELVNYNQYTGTPELVHNPNTGRPAIGTLHDPIEIHKTLKKCEEDKKD